MKIKPINNKRDILDIFLITVAAICVITGFFCGCYVVIQGMVVAWQWVIACLVLYLIAIVIEFIKNY